MEDVKRPATYSEYPRKPLSQDDEGLNSLSVISLICGLVSVLFSSKIMGWLSVFAAVASLTWVNFYHFDKFNAFVSVGFSIMSIISTYMKDRLETVGKH